MFLKTLQFCVDLRAGQDGRFSKNKIWKNINLQCRWENLKERKLSSFLGARTEDVLHPFMWNLEVARRSRAT